eukprot:387498-Prymnesium_polylepis.1
MADRSKDIVDELNDAVLPVAANGVLQRMLKADWEVEKEARAAAAVMKAMAKFLQDVDVQGSGAAVLWIFADDYEISAAIRPDAIDTALVALKAHPEEETRAFNCVMLVARLCTQYEGSCPDARRDAVARVADSDLIGTILDVVESLPCSKKVRLRSPVSIAVVNLEAMIYFLHDVALIRFQAVERLKVTQLRKLCELLCFKIQHGSKQQLLSMIKFVTKDSTDDYVPSEEEDEDTDEDDDAVEEETWLKL